MPKAEAGTPKWLANKMKSKGLQKLKWYCQMCEKQCRDENGFKCHRLSEGHQRQMQIFCSNAHRFMDDFSKTFEHSFMQLMRTRYCKTRVLANTVYQELISDKQHVHMNATIWVTLSEFVLYLGRQGKCKVESTPKGWYLEYIDQEKLKREDSEEKRKHEISLEKKHQMLINKLIEESKSKGGYKESEYTNMKKSDENVVIHINDKEKKEEMPKIHVGNNVFSEKDDNLVKNYVNDKHEPKSIMEKLASQGPLIKRPRESKDDLLIQSGIIVKVLSKDKNHGKKCRVIHVDKKNSTATLESEGSKFSLPVKNLRTVIPAIGGKVQVLAGEHIGKIGILKKVNYDDYSAQIEINNSNNSKSVIANLPYEQFSKLFV